MLFMSGQHTNKTKPRHFRMMLNVLKTAMSTSCMIRIKNIRNGYLRVQYDLGTLFPLLQVRIASHLHRCGQSEDRAPFFILKILYGLGFP